MPYLTPLGCFALDLRGTRSTTDLQVLEGLCVIKTYRAGVSEGKPQPDSRRRHQIYVATNMFVLDRKTLLQHLYVEYDYLFYNN